MSLDEDPFDMFSFVFVKSAKRPSAGRPRSGTPNPSRNVSCARHGIRIGQVKEQTLYVVQLCAMCGERLRLHVPPRRDAHESLNVGCESKERIVVAVHEGATRAKRKPSHANPDLLRKR
jgi:hypothetical protein